MTSADAIAFTAASLAHRPGAAHVADQQPLVLLHDGLRAPPRPAARRPESLLHAESAPDRANLVDGSAPSVDQGEVGADAATMPVRRIALSSLAAVTLVAAAVLMTFWVALRPVDVGGCHTSLAPSAFTSALIPVHVVAAAVLSAFAWALSARRRGRTLPGRPTLYALIAGWAYVLASLAKHGLFGLLAITAMVAAPTIGVLGALALLVRTLIALRAPAPAWSDHAFSVQVLLWGALLIGLPANLAYAWSGGADIFCF
jgi:hypothetical protein